MIHIVRCFYKGGIVLLRVIILIIIKYVKDVTENVIF